MGGFGFGFRRRRRRRGASGAQPLRLVANNVRVIPGPFAAVTSGNEKIALRSRHFTGAAGTTELMPVYAGYYVVSTSGQPPVETNYGNAVAISCSLEIPIAPGPSKVFTFAFDGGNRVGSIANGAEEYMPDAPAPATFFGYVSEIPAGTEFYIVSQYEVAVGQNMPAGDSGQQGTVPSGETCYRGATSATDKVGTSGTLNSATGWTPISQRPYPIAVVGRTAAPQVSVAGVGDSIITGFGGFRGDGVNSYGGFFRVGVSAVNGHVLPNVLLGYNSDQARVNTGAVKRDAMLKYVTHVVCNFGTNDRSVLSRTPAQIIADLRAVWTKLKAAGVSHVEQVLITPKASGTYTTAAGQTELHSVDFTTLNASIIANVGANGLDDYIDLNSGGLADAAELRKWNTMGGIARTTDGVHPTNQGHHSDAAPLLNARAETWSMG